MATYNEEVRDALIRHQIGLMRLVAGISKQTIERLDATEPLMKDFIQRTLRDGMDVNAKAVKRLEKKIAELRGKAFDDVFDIWNEELINLALAEPAFIANAAQASVGVVLGLSLPEESLLRAIVTKQPFQGKLLRDWAKTIEASDLGRISDQIKIGLVQGDSVPDIARRVVGTVQLKGTDGVTQITRRAANGITRTAVNHVSNRAKREFYQANQDIIQQEMYLATLDSRTTTICASLDGKVFPVGRGEIPPLHLQCRSTRVPIFDGKVLGNRPFKSATERELVREYANKNNLGTVNQRALLPKGHKGKFDQFARVRTRELTGTVPAAQTYSEFLGKQTVAFQEEVLGVTKSKLFREGKLPLDKFVNRRGDELSLSQLAAKEAEAFKAAGLDPEEFL